MLSECTLSIPSENIGKLMALCSFQGTQKWTIKKKCNKFVQSWNYNTSRIVFGYKKVIKANLQLNLQEL